MSKDEIFASLQQLLAELFELDAADIRLDSNLGEDLDLDSIDAIDMVARLQKMTGRRLELSSLTGIKTVSDVVDVVERHLRDGETLDSSG